MLKGDVRAGSALAAGNYEKKSFLFVFSDLFFFFFVLINFFRGQALYF